jgi:triosephosphate isomerase
MLLDLGARTILLGHSERRHELGESDELISRKMRAVLEHGGTPVLCVGETEEERRQGLTFTTIEGQLRAGLTGLGAEQIARIVLAYEPVWAIGTGLTATPAQAGEVHGYLRGLLSELASADIAQGIRILYGGSVKPENTDALMAEPEIDGALVGGASLDVSSFLAIVENSARAGGALKGD